MGSFTNKIEPRIRALNFGNTLWAGKPTTFYLALGTTTPDEDGVWTELSGNGYGRQAIACNTTNWDVALNAVSNKLAINFTAQATAPWEGIVTWALFTASTKGDMIVWGSVASKTVEKWGSPTFGIGDIQVRCGGSWGTFAANKTLKYLFHAAAWTNIPTHYVGFGSNADADKLDGEPVAINGASATGYARTSYANTTAKWPVSSSSNSGATNGAAVSGIPTATQEWGYLPVGALLDGPIFTGATWKMSAAAYGTASGQTAASSVNYTQTGNVIVVDWTSHGTTVGTKFYLVAGSGTLATGHYVVSVVNNADQITLVSSVSASTSGTVTLYRTGRKIGITYAAGLPSWLATTNPQTGAAQHVDVWFKSTTHQPISRRYTITGVSGNALECEAATDEEPLFTPAVTTYNCDFSVANILGFGTLTAAMTINAPDTPAVPQGAITAAFD